MNRVSTRMLLLALFALQSEIATAKDDSAPTTTESEPVQEIIVTGSRIARRDYFSASPVVSLDRTEITLSGNTEINKLINELPQIDPGAGSGTGNDPFGDARINLRGLGDIRSLALLNGRRYASSSIFGAADLNTLPSVLIERVEVTTGGASAVYGSDAIAGAVNFILRNDFEGIETSLQYDVTGEGDGETYNVDVAYGTEFSNSRGHIALFGNYYSRSVVFQDARDFSATPLTGDDDTGEIVSDESFVSGSGAIDGDLGVDFFTFDDVGRPRLFIDPGDRFNTAPLDALLAPIDRYSLNAFGRYDIGDRLQSLFEFSFTHSEPEQRRADVFSSFVDVNVDRPDITPELANLLASTYDTDGDGIASFRFLRRFSPERGNPILLNDRDFLRGVLGIQGDLGETWRWSVDYSNTSTNTDLIVSNDNSVSRLLQGLLVDPLTGECFDPSGGCVAVNPFGAGNLSEAALGFIALDNTGSNSKVTEQIANVTLSGPLKLTESRKVDIVLGAEYRQTKSRLIPSQSILSGDSMFFGSDVASSGTISVGEAFAEARLPLVIDAPWAEYVGIEAGLRASDYNIVDKMLWTWKLGGEWEFVNGLRFRVMQQRAVRVPTAAELFQGNADAGLFFALGPIFDQCSASRDPVGNGLADLCIAQGIPADQIGVFEAGFFPTAISFASNPNLDAEEADTLTAGVVWQPGFAPSFSTSLDYFNIEIDNASAFLSPDNAVTLCFLTREARDQFCSTFDRGPTNNIETALVTFVNAARTRTEGLDLALNWSWKADALAMFDGYSGFDVSVIASYYLEAGTQGSPLTPFLDCAGKFGAFCGDFVFLGALPDIRTNTRLTYRSGPFAASFAVAIRWWYAQC